MLVQVKSHSEILETLDADGTLGDLPFMPEMLRYCGRRMRVYRRADKTCDTVGTSGGRRMVGTVHLESSRCDGSAHGDCEAGCLLFWKEDWLLPVGKSENLDWTATPNESHGPPPETVQALGTHCTVDDGGTTCYRCQATELPKASCPQSGSDLRQYYRDLRFGNVRVLEMLRVAFPYWIHKLIRRGIAQHQLTRLYDRMRGSDGAAGYPYKHGQVPKHKRTPSADLNLQVGERVRVKRYEEILGTIDHNNKNRGMRFDAEMVPYCGGTYRVQRRVKKIINERTGRMLTFDNPCIVLDGVVCKSEFSDRRLFCPRSITPYWREIWLERVSEPVRLPVRAPVEVSVAREYVEA